MSDCIEFWFEFGSTYSYLSAMRVESVAKDEGVTIKWKPFLLGPIFKDQGWDTSPFNIYPIKGRYMWRDIERLCEKYGIAFKKPSVFPRNSLLAARISCIAQDEGWCAEFSRAVFFANFAEDREISDPETINEIVDSIGRDGPKLIAQTKLPEIKNLLRNQTEEAMNRGIFGAPTFIVESELFWGNDRLGDAIEWYKLKVN
ncbi:2-hydroxychromene-2-carboxylate isomerase [Desulfobacterota bacterium AH_259_B03_O07]|nr:2-hydroxychromene-2-carboxylate isomerase [Desulfobacterota bacterium AH_259_B03_O07]